MMNNIDICIETVVKTCVMSHTRQYDNISALIYTLCLIYDNVITMSRWSVNYPNYSINNELGGI